VAEVLPGYKRGVGGGLAVLLLHPPKSRRTSVVEC